MSRYLTPEGLEKIKEELNYLKTVKRKEIAERLKQAISFGDLSENFAYHQAKEDQAFVEGRIRELEQIIRTAKVIEKPSEKNKEKKVEIGSRVTLIHKGKKEVLQIVGSEEANPLEGKISYNSPLGKALLGKLKGDVVVVETPEGKTKYKIVDCGG